MPTITFACDHCGKARTAYRRPKLTLHYCSRRCTMLANKKVKRIGIDWEHRKRSQRRWRERNALRLKQVKLIYYQQNKEAIMQRVREWKKSHPDARYAEKQARRARQQQVTVAPVNRQDIYKRDQGICQLCGLRVKKAEISMDHIVPISLGGTHEPRNVQLAHVLCNVRRGAGRTPAQMRIF